MANEEARHEGGHTGVAGSMVQRKRNAELTILVVLAIWPTKNTNVALISFGVAGSIAHHGNDM